MQRKVIEVNNFISFIRHIKNWNYPEVIKYVYYEPTSYDLSELEELGILDEELEEELQPQTAKRVIALYDGQKLYCSYGISREDIKRDLLK